MTEEYQRARKIRSKRRQRDPKSSWRGEPRNQFHMVIHSPESQGWAVLAAGVQGEG